MSEAMHINIIRMLSENIINGYHVRLYRSSLKPMKNVIKL